MNDHIFLFDGENEIEYELIASFGVGEKEYCFLAKPDDDEGYFFRYRTIDDDMEFEAITDEDELAEVAGIYDELVDEYEKEHNTANGEK